MIDVIQTKFEEIVSKCLEKNAKKENVSKKDMQLIFKLGADGKSEYILYKNYQPLRVLDFLDVLCVPFDFKGYSAYVPDFITGALLRFCEENSIPQDKVRVVTTFQDNKFYLWLYNHTDFVKQINLESLFDIQDVAIDG